MKMTEITVKTRRYEWGGDVYLQQDGFPTGLHPSGLIRRIYMDHWVEKLREIEELTNALHTLNPVSFEKLKTHLIKKYVDNSI